MIIDCPNCGKKVSDRAPYCSNCAHPIAAKPRPEEPEPKAAPEPEPEPAPRRPQGPPPIDNPLRRSTPTIRLDCSACKGESTMKPTKVSRFSGILRLIGYLIVTPSLLGVGLGMLMALSTCRSSLDMAAKATTDAQHTATGLTFMVGQGMAFGIIIPALIAGTIGWVLLLKRSVYKCEVCGFVIERS